MPHTPAPTDGTQSGSSASVWGIVSQPGVLEALEAVARRNRYDWPFASWSARSVTHETLIGMTDQTSLPSDPDGFLAAFTVHLKRTLADKYRRKNAKKRGAGRVRQAFGRLLGVASRESVADAEIVGLVDEYLRTKPLHVVIAWMSADLGLSEDEIGPVLGIDPESVRRKLRRVKAELRHELDPHDRPRGR